MTVASAHYILFSKFGFINISRLTKEITVSQSCRKVLNTYFEKQISKDNGNHETINIENTHQVRQYLRRKKLSQCLSQ